MIDSSKKRPFPASRFSRSELSALYLTAPRIFSERFGYSPREDVERLLTALWDERRPRTDSEFRDFYRDNLLVPEENALWYGKDGGKRSSRTHVVGSIAHSLGFRTFSEFGSGIGMDALSLTYQGFEPLWLSDISLRSLELIPDIFSKNGFPLHPRLVDLYLTDPSTLPPSDFLYSSDALEHVKDPERTLGDWIKKYRALFIYAPFGSNSEQHQHTSYPASRFHKFMARKGFEKVVYNLAVPPFVYLNMRRL